MALRLPFLFVKAAMKGRADSCRRPSMFAGI
jgi:hypothetical protein